MFYSSKEIKSVGIRHDEESSEEDKNPSENSNWNEFEEEKVKMPKKEKIKSYHETPENPRIIKLEYLIKHILK